MNDTKKLDLIIKKLSDMEASIKKTDKEMASFNKQCDKDFQILHAKLSMIHDDVKKIKEWVPTSNSGLLPKPKAKPKSRTAAN